STQRGPVRISQLYEEAADERRHGGGFSRLPRDLFAVSADGRYVPVRRLFKHDFRGDLVEIEALSASPLLVTPGHEVVAARPGESTPTKVRAAELSTEDRVVIPRPKHDENGSERPDLLEPFTEGVIGQSSILVPIHRVSRVPYSGPVYNLE